MDLSDISNVTFVIDSQHVNQIKELLLKRKIQYFTKGCLDFIAYEENKLYDALKYYCNNRKNVFVIFLNAALYYNPYLPGTLRKYKKIWKNLRYILFYLDIMNVPVSRNADILRKQGVFDLIYTIDSVDAETADVLLWNTFYSANKTYFNIQTKNDMYFCGVSKGRSEILTSCMLKAKKNNVDMAMDIVCYNDADLFDIGLPEINIHTPKDYLTYQDVLKNELNAQCILDVVQKGQTALTLRPYEAVVYNRKLVTNNKSILKFPFYDERFMRYFEYPEDIDWNWVKAKATVDYGYKGEFSPVHLIEDIRLRLEK
jgi:hypothetical protein